MPLGGYIGKTQINIILFFRQASRQEERTKQQQRLV